MEKALKIMNGMKSRKVELAAKAEPIKVELSSISEMNEVASKAEQLANQIAPLTKIFNDAFFAVDKAEKLIAEADKLYRDGSSKGNEFFSKVESIGLVARNFKEYTNMFDTMNNMAQRMGALETLAKKYR